MITILKRGTYRLIETKRNTKILILDGKETFAWVNTIGVGEILVASSKMHKTDCTLAVGNYRIYSVKDEAELSDQLHVELFVGCGEWQGYLLPTGLPAHKKRRNRIIPTKEIISTTNEAASLLTCVCHAEQ